MAETQAVRIIIVDKQSLHTQQPRSWDLRGRQVAAVIKAATEGVFMLSGPERLAAARGIAILQTAARFTPEAPSIDIPDLDPDRLRDIAESLAADARDGGGYSEETRARIASDADLIRSIAHLVEVAWHDGGAALSGEPTDE